MADMLGAPHEPASADAPASEPHSLDKRASTEAGPDTTIAKSNGNTAIDAEDVKANAEEDPVDSTNAASTDPLADDGAATDAANKKNSKRKSGSGVPEHKSKKLNRKKSIVLQLDAEPGQHFWARLKGFPPWPSIICDDEMLPESLLQNRPVTAKRPDGSYREDFLAGGKNVRDRTYPVMYLGTYEFSWANNTDITPLKADEVEISEGKGKKLSKALQAAYVEAGEQNSIDHYKNKLAQFVAEKEQAEEAAAEAEAAKAKAAEEKKAKREQKNKRKSKDARDEDSIMEDFDENGTPSDKKASKKRRKEADSEEEKPVKTPKTIKLSSAGKTPNGDSASKQKSKPKQASASKPAKAEPTEAEKREKREQEILYFRHKLQKGLLPRDSPPLEKDMKQMAVYFDNLEKYKDLEAPIILKTRIHKVLKGILKLANIPLDHEYRFQERSMNLLKEWNKVLGETGPAEAKTDGETTTSNTNEDKADRPESAPAEGEQTSTNADESKKDPSEKAGETKDVPMADASVTEARPAEQAEKSAETRPSAVPEAAHADKPAETTAAVA